MFNRKNPFLAELKKKKLLSGTGSQKEVWHYELSLENSKLSYEVGDSIGIFPKNVPDVVDSLLKVVKKYGISGSDSITFLDKKMTLKEVMTEHLDITNLSKSFLKKYKKYSKSTHLEEVLSMDRGEFSTYLWGRQVIDAFDEFPIDELSLEDFYKLFKPIQPRLYSIASSLKKFPNEVHLTIASVRYDTKNITRKGVASTYLADVIKKGDKVPIFVQPNRGFRLPESLDQSMIMIGPGTGIAPFRAFIQEREVLSKNKTNGTLGNNWLIFGDQHEATDFYYEKEFVKYKDKKIISELDLAWSRDQDEKIYVQDKLNENADKVIKWIDEGAYIYVCGDAKRMAKDVHSTLVGIISEKKSLSNEEAEVFIKNLQRNKKYQRDIY